MTKLLAAVLIGTFMAFDPTAQAEKNEGVDAAMAAKMTQAVPASNANAADLKVFPGVPGITAADAGVAPEGRKPDATVAWLLALGFLGVVVLRRTRSGPTM
jgi:hypothetical protein